MSSRTPLSGRWPGKQYSFSDFTLDPLAGSLCCGGEKIDLRPKSFEVLAHLVKHHGRLVTREELMQSVWPDVEVTDESITRCIADIRKAVRGEPLIRTVPGRGYLFAVPVTTPALEFPRSASTGAVPVEVVSVSAKYLRRIVICSIALVSVVVVAMLARWRIHPAKKELTYEQITSFADSAVSPAFSPDGKMLAFLRSEKWFLSPDQIYVKMLPNGAPIQVTHDPRLKYGPVFSPDGARIAYTVAPWSTYLISPLGGEPTLFLTNSSGVTWLDGQHILFSEVRPRYSTHMGVVTAREDRSEMRTVYFPPEERGMVHISYASPDRKWVLALEMNPVWPTINLDAEIHPLSVWRPGGRSAIAIGPNLTSGGTTIQWKYAAWPS